MRRVAVVGCSGSGKSTLSRALATALTLPVVHLDHLYWQPGWTPTPEDEWRAIQTGLVAADRWIMDGTYSSSIQIRLARADTVVFIDRPRRTCLTRVLRRTLRSYGTSIQAPGCPERFDREFLSYVWHYRARHRPRVLEALDQFPHLEVVRLRTDREIDAFLRARRSW